MSKVTKILRHTLGELLMFLLVIPLLILACLPLVLCLPIVFVSMGFMMSLLALHLPGIVIGLSVIILWVVFNAKVERFLNYLFSLSKSFEKWIARFSQRLSIWMEN